MWKISDLIWDMTMKDLGFVEKWGFEIWSNDLNPFLERFQLKIRFEIWYAQADETVYWIVSAVVRQIFFTELKYTFVETQAAYTSQSLLCDVGGCLGLILGATMLTLCETTDFICRLFVHWVRTRASEVVVVAPSRRRDRRSGPHRSATAPHTWGFSPVFFDLSNSVVLDNESVPIQLAQCRSLPWAGHFQC